MELLVEKSAPGTLNSFDYKKILRDTAYFFSVPALFYIAQILTEVNLPGHVFTWGDFAPHNPTIIAIISWILNQVANTIRKFVQ